jgi:hypothetical protein
MTPSSSLNKIAVLTKRMAGLEADRKTAIAQAVAAGAPWADIGAALGVSAQAAHRRFRWLRHSRTTG